MQWLSEQRPELANKIFVDVSAQTGLRPGQRWKEALRQANDRCEAVICLLSRNWESSANCKTEYLTAENLGKQILVARLEDLGDTDIASSDLNAHRVCPQSGKFETGIQRGAYATARNELSSNHSSCCSCLLFLE